MIAVPIDKIALEIMMLSSIHGVTLACMIAATHFSEMSVFWSAGIYFLSTTVHLMCMMGLFLILMKEHDRIIPFIQTDPDLRKGNSLFEDVLCTFHFFIVLYSIGVGCHAESICDSYVTLIPVAAVYVCAPMSAAMMFKREMRRQNSVP